MEYAACCVPVSALRATPGHRSEMVTQLLFGECCQVTEVQADGWAKVVCTYDQYEGWCLSSQITAIDQEDLRAVHPGLSADLRDVHSGLSADWINDISYNGHPMHIPLGSSLTLVRNGKGSWRKNELRYAGNVWEPTAHKPDTKSIRSKALMYLNTPYLWGGKSVFGIDCSGFTQSVYRFFQVPLLRDAAQQATQGDIVGFLQEARAGDLAFFDNEEGRITHVGILLSDLEIIHASGKVRIDRIDNQGIINGDTGKRTHTLRIIRRLW